MKKKVRGIIKEDGKILLIHRIKKDRNYWVFPGGSVEEYDPSLEVALKREMKEELGVEVELTGLYAEDNFNDTIEYFYNCKIISGELGTGDGPEFQEGNDYEGEYILEWIDINDFKNKNIFPENIKEMIFNLYKV